MDLIIASSRNLIEYRNVVIVHHYCRYETLHYYRINITASSENPITISLHVDGEAPLH